MGPNVPPTPRIRRTTSPKTFPLLPSLKQIASMAWRSRSSATLTDGNRFVVEIFYMEQAPIWWCEYVPSIEKFYIRLNLRFNLRIRQEIK